MNTRRKVINLLLVATVFVCMATMILFNQLSTKTTAYASAETELSTELESNDPEAHLVYEGLLSDSAPPMTTYAWSAHSIFGLRIDNHEKLTNMTTFPNHDGNNGCGIVAMGIMLKFFNELELKMVLFQIQIGTITRVT